jgi:hypothetical protein
MYNYQDYVSSADRFGVYGTHEYHIHQLARKLKTSVDVVISAVQEVGFDPDEVSEYIRDREERGF